MTVKIFNRPVIVPKNGTRKEKFQICGFTIAVVISNAEIGSISVISVIVIVNKCIISSVDFTKETIRDSSRADLLILQSVFNTRISADILKRINP